MTICKLKGIAGRIYSGLFNKYRNRRSISVRIQGNIYAEIIVQILDKILQISGHRRALGEVTFEQVPN
jgi:hypothetical protein